ncbi:hypothetical protein BJ170DRAFT_76741 [Xylariales sp. AK1849]|nr:hypothetical protein BJ170DRAFT_76741 [Xylariales sp. AK1849]
MAVLLSQLLLVVLPSGSSLAWLSLWTKALSELFIVNQGTEIMATAGKLTGLSPQTFCFANRVQATSHQVTSYLASSFFSKLGCLPSGNGCIGCI